MMAAVQEHARFPRFDVPDPFPEEWRSLVLKAVGKAALNRGLAPGSRLDLVLCRNTVAFGREAWIAVLDELLEPAPEEGTALEGSSMEYFGRYEVPSRAEA